MRRKTQFFSVVRTIAEKIGRKFSFLFKTTSGEITESLVLWIVKNDPFTILSLTKTRNTVTNEGHALAHDPGSAIVRVRMNLDLGIFRP